MPRAASVLWLRRDLRRGDLPALGAADSAADGGNVLVLFVLDPALWDGGGPARRAWLAATLEATREAYDGRLCLRVGDPRKVVPAVVQEVGAGSVHVSRETTPAGVRRDKAVAAALGKAGVDWVETGTPYAVGPGSVRNGSGDPYKVFTPFSRAWRDHGWPAPATEPKDLSPARVASDDDGWKTVREALSVDGLPAMPEAGEAAGLARWRDFLDEAVTAYKDERDRADHPGTSRMSPYLKIGAVHPRTLLAELKGRTGQGAQTYATELCWREFYADVLWHHPRSSWHDLRPALSGMTYEDHPELVDAWKQGRTGYPVVDAAMRQLLTEGWMHNRMRMVTASFLTKDLHVWWPVGARHFLDHLIDGDIASNNHGWQWVAGTGTDASPYFRVFNPVTQGQRFDPQGDYVRRYVPELAHIPGKAVHEPWKHDAGYDHDYPERVVDHAEERLEALRRYDAVRGGAGSGGSRSGGTESGSGSS
ncbi:deoxyribodipyrimidine photo-lyase [Phycicoccus sp. Soil748]|uniref:cryptochrome/photolyase family protein n=1 Tax=Phycicoccus sp. Soil748 TaxID=1736397 RepID=UPI000703B683|nr:deoxyribodipyrimidine photo-lyase [Phycicoccus sp. Soil748]KRE58701.1 deoxyribodipyrimidine photolyase [Phycicoccus sp. Soil748]